MGAPGPFPATWCNRCTAINHVTREEQLDYYRKRALACAARFSDLVEHRQYIETMFDNRMQVGTGYIDVQAEIEKARRRKMSEMYSCMDWAPEERGMSLIYS